MVVISAPEGYAYDAFQKNVFIHVSSTCECLSVCPSLFASVRFCLAGPPFGGCDFCVSLFAGPPLVVVISALEGYAYDAVKNVLFHLSSTCECLSSVHISFFICPFRLAGPPLVVVISALEGYAYDAGVRPGDVILAVDGKEVTGRPVDEVSCK